MKEKFIGNEADVHLAKAYTEYYRSGLHWGDTFKVEKNPKPRLQEVDEIPDDEI